MKVAVVCVLSLVLAEGAISVAAAQAQVSRTYLVAASGRPLEVAKYSAINPDCSSMGATQVNLIEAARGGAVQVGEGRRYSAFAPGNPRAACNRRKVAATFVTYRSAPGFVGQDTFVIEAIFPNGAAQRARLTVSVR